MGKTYVACFFFVVISLWFSSNWQAWRNQKFSSRVSRVYAAQETFTTSGSWQAPAGVTSVIVEVWGGGGGGGGGGGSNKNGGGGGAGGQYAKKTLSVTPLNNYSYSVGGGGSGGVGGSSATNGIAGSDSTFNSTSVVAKGGQPGIRQAGGATGGQGSITNGVGDLVYAGGNGVTGTSTYGGGGGGGAGSTGTGNNGSTSTGGVAKTEYGGTGGDGNTSNSGAGNLGNNYAAGGGGGTKNGGGGDGTPGLIRLTYNAPPSFTANTTDVPDPVTVGSTVTFSATATDAESNTWYLAVCKTDAITPGSPPSCATSQTYCVSSSAVSSGSQNSCTWTSDGSGAQNWYAFACDTNSTPSCSAADTTNSPITVNAAQVYSVSITPGGTIVYGTVEGGQTKSTIDTTSTQTATNDGNTTGDLNIMTSNAVNGTAWTIGSSPGSNVFVHEFSTNSGGNWTKFTAADSYQTLATGVAVSGTIDFDLRVTVPTDSDSQEKTITITVQAVAPQ